MQSLVDYSSSESDSDGPSVQDFRLRQCAPCNIRFNTVVDLQVHLRAVHPSFFNTTIQEGGALALERHQGAIDNTYEEFELKLTNVQPITINRVFKGMRGSVLRLMRQKLVQKKNYKIQFAAYPHFNKENQDGTVSNSYPIFQSFLYSVTNEGDFGFVLNRAHMYFKRRVEEFIELGSNFNFVSVLKFLVTFAENIHYNAGEEVILPALLQRKMKCIFNVPGNTKCFKRSVHLHPELRPAFPNISARSLAKLLSKRSYYENVFLSNPLNWSGIDFPFSISQVKKFERQNPSVGLTIIAYDDDRELEKPDPLPRNAVDDTIDAVVSAIREEDNGESDEVFLTPTQSRTKLRNDVREKCFPLYTCKEDRPIRVDLLMVLTPNGSHFLFIKSLQQLLYTSTRTGKEVCRFCLQQFTRGRIYDEHVRYCAILGNQKTSFPQEKFLRFSHFNRTIKMPNLAFLDFESTIGSIPFIETNTTRLAVHSPGAYSYVCVDHNNEIKAKKAYHARGDENVAKKVITELVQLSERLSKETEEREAQSRTTMTFTPQQEAQLRDPEFRRQQSCYFCHEKFNHFEKVHRHHCHLTFQFVGLAHGKCNMAARVKKNELVIVVHNFKGYDSKLILEGLNNHDLIEDVEVIANNSEKFNCVFLKSKSGQTLRFIDSMSFFPASLATLAEGLAPEDFKITRKAFEEFDVELLLRKGVYCYSYVDSPERYGELCLPPIESFKNDLTGDDISPAEYAHAQRVWDSFGCQTLGDYTSLYCLSDTTILADYFLRVREIIFDSYGLDMAHYFSLPMLSFDATLKVTGVHLENIQDPTMYNFFEASIRGGLVSVGDLRAAEANNPQVAPGDFNPNLPTSWLLYLDENNLYGYCLTDKLPLKDYKWVEAADLETFRANPLEYLTSLDEDTGCFVELDIEIPAELHEKLNIYPPCPYKRTVDISEISESMRDLAEELQIPISTYNCERLMADFHPRKNYITHGCNLRYWIELGCRVTVIHRAVRFTQSAWLKPLIDFNTAKRQAAQTQVEKDFWKLASNAIFGKFVENKRARVNVRIICDRKRALKFNKKPTVQNVKIIHSNLVLLTLTKLEVVLDRPIAVGSSCLELSKLHMFKFIYDFVYPKYGKNAKLIYSDTDSFALYVETDNIYEDMKGAEGSMFDLSKYDQNDAFFGRYYSDRNANRLGALKDELPNAIITQFVVNKPKQYAVRYIKRNVDSETGLNVYTTDYKQTAKGIPKRALKRTYNFDDFVEAIGSPKNSIVTSKSIRSFDQKLFTVESKRRGVNGFDVKRFILPDMITTLAYNHKDIKTYYS